VKVLLHACCAPCTVMPLRELRAEGADVTLLFANPNIHPYSEWKARLEAFEEYCAERGLSMLSSQRYGLCDFVTNIKEHIQKPERCRLCYRMRLRTTARSASENGFDAFSTTLLVSPYQDCQVIRHEAEAAADEAGVLFLCRDWRDLFREGNRVARQLGLYMQKYCGCVFSEYERYAE